MDNLPLGEQTRQSIIDLCRRLLDGELGVFDVLPSLCRFYLDIDKSDQRLRSLLAVYLAIDLNTDHLPLGTDPALWHDNAFGGESLQQVTQMLEAEYRQEARQAAQDLLALLDDPEKHRAIDRILHDVWDPFDISEVPAAAREYAMYVGGVYEMLRCGATVSELMAHLCAIERGSMGLIGDRENAEQAAACLLSAWSEIDKTGQLALPGSSSD